MTKSIHFRFASYVLCVTTLLAGAIFLPCFFPHHEGVFICFYCLLPYAREILGPTFKGWHERDREITNRTLIIGFIVALVIVWVGGIAAAHYFSPEHNSLKYLFWLVLIIFATVWMLLIYPAFQWWRVQSAEIHAA